MALHNGGLQGLPSIYCTIQMHIAVKRLLVPEELKGIPMDLSSLMLVVSAAWLHPPLRSQTLTSS